MGSTEADYYVETRHALSTASTTELQVMNYRYCVKDNYKKKAITNFGYCLCNIF